MLGIFGGKKHVVSGLTEYEKESARIAKHVVMRFARGNVSLMQGRYLDQEGLDDLRARGDKAQKNIEKFLEENGIDWRKEPSRSE